MPSKSLNMSLIVEAGATSSSWVLLSSDGGKTFAETAGINLAAMPAKAVRDRVMEAAGLLGDPAGVSRVFFYAAGLIKKEGETVPGCAADLDKAFSEVFPGVACEYESDMLAAARAVCGSEPGIVGILGTGSNSCFYDGEKIVRTIPSGGFILGDEGSAARLGKMFLSDWIKGLMPVTLHDEFAEDFNADYPSIVKNVYKSDSPSSYLGSLAPWIMKRYESSDYVKNLVEGNFADFISRSLSAHDVKTYPVGIAGGFGYACQEIFRKVAERSGIRVTKFIDKPIQGLIEYHSAR